MDNLKDFSSSSDYETLKTGTIMRVTNRAVQVEPIEEHAF